MTPTCSGNRIYTDLSTALPLPHFSYVSCFRLQSGHLALPRKDIKSRRLQNLVASIAPPNHTRREGTTDNWVTPKWLVDRLVGFDLDPCACDPQPWPCAAKQFTIEDDGLLQTWKGFVYCNPPYGRKLEAWLNRMAMHNNGVALIFARTETRAFFKHVWPSAVSLLFLRGRLTFSRPDGSNPKAGHNSGGPSVMIAWGKRADRVLQDLADLGAYVRI